MGFADLRSQIESRLDEADRGDRAWWLLTRVHLSPERLKAIAGYIHDAAADGPLHLSASHYRALAEMLGVSGPKPGQTINRHYFLAMDSPLRLIDRLNGNHWDQIQLSAQGLRLALNADSNAVFEESLSSIVFCREPWYSAGRAQEYSAFNVRPLEACIQTLSSTGGWIDVDEFDLFVSRIRTLAEVPAAIAGIGEFRALSESQRKQLLQLVKNRVPSGGGANPDKPYQNWRDMARHTFSLLSLGSSLTRAGNTLHLSSKLVGAAKASGAGAKVSGVSDSLTTGAIQFAGQAKKVASLKMPDSTPSAELEVPPVAPVSNTGSDGELFVGKLLTAAGWQVVYYTHRRGFGFDLWAKKGDQHFVVEVKSSVGSGGQITLTALEYAAAKHHAKNFLLVIVEGISSDDPTIFVIQDPANKLELKESSTTHYQVGAASWKAVAKSGLVS